MSLRGKLLIAYACLLAFCVAGCLVVSSLFMAASLQDLQATSGQTEASAPSQSEQVLSRAGNPAEGPRLFGSLVLVGGAIFLLSLVISAWITQWLTDPLSAMSLDVTRISRTGRLSTRLPERTGTKEMRDLSIAYNSLLERLQDASMSRNYIQSIFHSINEGILVLDRELKVASCNRAILQLLNRSEGELKGLHISTIIRMKDGAADDLTSESILKLHDEPAEISDDAAQPIPILISASLLRSEERDQVIATLKDARELRLLQKQLIQSSKMASLGVMGAGIAHELNNPLAIVKGYAESLTGGIVGPDRVPKIAEKILQSSERMGKIVNHLRSYARESQDEDWKLINITETAEQTLSFFGRQLRSSGIEVEQKLDHDVPHMWGDKVQIESVLQNFLTNAKDAFDDVEDDRERKIRIRTEVIEEELVLTIEDNASGMTDEVRERLFDPFFTTKEVGKGTGLGMSISIGIIEKHGGRLNIETNQGKGSKFTIYLPPANPEDTKYQIHTQGGDRKAVLVVDDEQPIVDLLRGLLESDFQVVTCTDSVSALTRCREEMWAAVISDLRMPQVPGEKVIEHAVRYNPDAAIIAMTGYELSKDEVNNVFKVGASYILQKPIPRREHFLDLVWKLITEAEERSKKEAI